jgi:GNAT superfamily N-acetyltransferase
MTYADGKEGKLKDGSRVLLRPMVAEDRQRLVSFFESIPEEERVYFRDDVTDPEVIRDWTEHIDYTKVFPLLALVGDRIVGDATLHLIPYGWKRHIGTVRMVVAPEYQSRGLGTLLLNELVGLAGELGLEKLWAELPLMGAAAVAVFNKAGFSSKAVIEGLTKDLHGRNTDMVIMVCDVGA